MTGSSVLEILQARILGWVAISFSRGSSQSRDQIQVSHIENRFFTIWDTRESLFLAVARFNFIFISSGHFINHMII